MDILGVIIPLVQCVSPHIAKRWEYHKDLNKNLEALREALDKLNNRKRDIEAKLDSKIVQGETEEGSEVKSWLNCVERVNQEIKELDEKARNVRFFSRASFGEKVVEKKVKVDELYQDSAFSEGDLVKRLPQRGNVMPTEAIVEGETTFKKKREEIWRCLIDDNVTKIGVYGMGGIGKTTALEQINNRLLEENDKFDKVVWVTVSNNSNIRSLQDKIAHKLNLDISKVDDEEIRAEELRKGFVRSKRYVLILDDLWKAEHDILKKVGIPDPAPINGCKLVLTTRSLNVCRMINCDSEIEMNPLTEKEALDLFIEKVGRDVSSNPKLEKLVEQVARECARLPLAIVVIAGSLRKKTDPNEWEVALVELKDATASISSEVMRNLRLSYDWLKDTKLKDCLLYCALYAEDYLIERNLLIDELIADGIVEDVKTGQYQIGKGHVMLNELVSVCLLNDTINYEGNVCVKLHDLIRDMAIQIMRETPSRFLIKAGEALKSLPDKENWNDNLEKVTLMGNNIVEIPSTTEPPKCSNISTFFLNSNSHLKSIPTDFFGHMKGLNVLDLSNTDITSLPESIGYLVNLVVLLLRDCRNLIYVPSLAKLRNMRRLDFYNTSIEEVPKGMEMLIKLTYLNLSWSRLKLIPDGILCKLTNLRCLSIIPSVDPLLFRGEELSNLTKLETLEFSVANIDSFHACVRALENGEGLTTLKLFVGPCRSVTDLFMRPKQKTVYLHACNIRSESAAEDGNGFPLQLPKSIGELYIEGCQLNVSTLCQLTSLEYATNLTEICIVLCDDIEHLFHCSPNIFPLLQKLVRLELHTLDNFRGLLVSKERASLPLPPGSFSSLKVLHLISCDKVKNLFILNNASFPNLENICIYYCAQLEETISIPSSENDQEAEVSESYYRANANTVTLPKLRTLCLSDLPKLKSIPFVSDALENITIQECPNLKRILLLDREPCPPSLQLVGISENLLESIEWDHPNAKEAIRKSAYKKPALVFSNIKSFGEDQKGKGRQFMKSDRSRTEQKNLCILFL